MKECCLRIVGKEVINVRDGARTGRISDVCVNMHSGNIEFIIVPVVKNIFSLIGKKKEYCIKWCSVVRVGEDVVLIDTDTGGCVRICEE